MKKCLVLLAVVLLVASIPAMAAKVTSVPITREAIPVLQAYPGCAEGLSAYAGYISAEGDVITAVPGVLSIVPGANWENFVGAAQAGVPYTIKNVVLRKVTPDIIQCADIFPVKIITQQGTPNIRVWWPLMYEVPGTNWTLTITYGTPVPYDDDGDGPNEATYVHTEVWSWYVDATLESMQDALALFHELPFGLDEVPLVSDEVLYPILQGMLCDIIEFYNAGNLADAGLTLAAFELEVADACIAVSPLYPNPTGLGTGIANSEENPACCKLMADAEYVGFGLDIFQQKK